MSAARPDRRDPADILRARQQGTAREAAPPRTLKTKPVKATFDIARPLYRKLRVWSAENEIPAVEVIRRLIAELLTDETLAQRIRNGGQETL